MSIVECQECGKSVSNLAVACVHCGNPYLKAAEPQLGTADFVRKPTSVQDKGSSDLTRKPLHYLYAFVFGAIGLWCGSNVGPILFHSSSTCPFVGFDSQNWASFSNAFLCYDQYSVVTAQWSQISVFSRIIFLVVMSPLSLIFCTLMWFSIERGRKAI